jgi:hypothetical protein
MSANPNVPVMFYSNRCEVCKEIIQTLQGLNKASLYRFVCVDTTPRHLIPPEIRAVPTVYNPYTKEVLTGKNAIFAQVAKPVQSRREIPTDRAPAGPAEPGAWSFSTAATFTDGYTTFDTATRMPDDQLYFTYLGGPQPPAPGGLAGGVPGPVRPDLPRAGEDTGGSRTGRNDDITARLEQMNAQRAAEFKGVSRV